MQTEQRNNHSKNKKHLMVVIYTYVHTQRFMPKKWRKVPSIWQVWEANMWRSTHGTWILVAHTMLAPWLMVHGSCVYLKTLDWWDKNFTSETRKPCRILCVKHISPITYHGFFVETSRLLTPWWVDFRFQWYPRAPQMMGLGLGNLLCLCNPITISVIGCSMNQ